MRSTPDLPASATKHEFRLTLTLLKRKEFGTLERIIRQHKPNGSVLDAITDSAARRAKIERIANTLVKTEHFIGWQEIQNGISHAFESVEFRRAGSIQMNLFTQRFGQEKGVDVKLATDVHKARRYLRCGHHRERRWRLRASSAVVKDWGKHIINVSFLKKSGGLLPGGARRLNQITDRAIEVAYDDMKKFMNVAVVKPTTAAAMGPIATPATPPAALPPHAFPPQAQKTTP